MVGSPAINAYLIFTHNVPVFGEKRPDKRPKFLKELSISLIVPQEKLRLVAPQTPQDVKQIIRSCGILPSAPPKLVHLGERGASSVQGRRTKNTGSPAVDIITASVKNTARWCALSARNKFFAKLLHYSTLISNNKTNFFPGLKCYLVNFQLSKGCFSVFQVPTYISVLIYCWSIFSVIFMCLSEFSVFFRLLKCTVINSKTLF